MNTFMRPFSVELNIPGYVTADYNHIASSDSFVTQSNYRFSYGTSCNILGWPIEDNLSLLNDSVVAVWRIKTRK